MNPALGPARASLPRSIRSRLADPAFWAAWQSGGVGDFEGLPNRARVRLPLRDGYALTLTVSRDLSRASLGLWVPGVPMVTEPVEIGADDVNPNRWHPHALRWAEVDLVARLQAAGGFRASGFLLHSYRQERGEAVRDMLAALDAGIALSADEPPADDGDDFPHEAFAAATAAAETWLTELVPAGWRTAAVRALAAATASDPAVAPVLADALFDAGCDRPDLLAALRSGTPARVGWVADWLAASPPSPAEAVR
jgi:hypothetical protein